MLRKTRRAPLQGSVNEQGVKQKVPFKRNLLKEIHAELTDDESRAPPSNFELTAAMMHRIILLEKTGGGDREQADVSIREEAEDSERSSTSWVTTVWSGLEMRRSVAQRRASRLTAQTKASGNTPPARSFSMNFDLVLQKIQDLNVLTGEGQRFIHKTASGAKLYRNGIEMFDGHFRSFQEQSTQLCMQDLVDDCFPSELQQRFPDGVPFEVQDRRHETFLVRLPWDTCPGEGRAVYEEKDEEFTNAVSLQSPGLTWSRLLPTILVFHLGSQEEADHRSEKAAKDGGQSRCGDRHQEFSEGDCRFRLILGAQRLLWTHLVAEGRYSAVKEHLLKLSSR